MKSRNGRALTTKVRPAAPADAHEWVSFADTDEDRTWVFDISFLTSPWTCIFGRGCLGVLTGPAPELEQGCCSYGAHFTDDEDLRRVHAASATLTAEQWQFHDYGRKKGIAKVNDEGETVSRLVDDACLFLNRPGFPGGPGCALHRAAVERGERPLDLKPNVCWQLPLRREDEVASDGHVTSTVRQWDRRHWGGGGAEFHWWCTQSPEAFVGHQPVYLELRDEIIAMTSADAYERMVAYLESRSAETAPASEPVAFLPHPSLRATEAAERT